MRKRIKKEQVYYNCQLKGCYKKHFGLGWCQMHYVRWSRYGHPMDTIKLPITGRSKHPLYGTYQNMKNRCYVLSNPAYPDYGGRGIKISEKWLGAGGFETFAKDMGEKPTPKHSIERIDHNGDYEPDNCRWATRHEQNGNTRRSAETVGVCYNKANNAWVAKLTVNGIHVIHKQYKKREDAVLARKEAEEKYL